MYNGSMKNVVVFSYLLFAFAFSNNTYFLKHQKVVHVIDGDTVVIQKGKKQEKVRLVGIQASELNPSPQPFSEDAKNFVIKELKNKYVTLEIFKPEPKDKYGRILAHVYIEPNNVWLQGLLLEQGLAFAYIFPNYNYKVQDLYQKEQKAMGKKLNMWGIKEFKVITAKEAGLNLHKYKIIRDRVFKVTQNKNVVLLGMGKHKKPLTVIIRNKEVAKLPFVINNLQNRTVQVRGFPYYKNGQVFLLLQKHFFIQVVS